jgi:hypothetical protein
LVWICEIRLLERIFGSKKEAGKNGIKRLIFSTNNTNTVRVIRETRMRLEACITLAERLEMPTKFPSKNCERKGLQGTHRHI